MGQELSTQQGDPSTWSTHEEFTHTAIATDNRDTVLRQATGKTAKDKSVNRRTTATHQKRGDSEHTGKTSLIEERGNSIDKNKRYSSKSDGDEKQTHLRGNNAIVKGTDTQSGKETQSRIRRKKTDVDDKGLQNVVRSELKRTQNNEDANHQTDKVMQIQSTTTPKTPRLNHRNSHFMTISDLGYIPKNTTRRSDLDVSEDVLRDPLDSDVKRIEKLLQQANKKIVGAQYTPSQAHDQTQTRVPESATRLPGKNEIITDTAKLPVVREEKSRGISNVDHSEGQVREQTTSPCGEATQKHLLDPEQHLTRNNETEIEQIPEAKLKQIPRLPGGQVIDVEKLKRIVKELGGHDHLSETRQWRKVATHFNVMSGCENLAAGKLKHVYSFLFLPPGSSAWIGNGFRQGQMKHDVGEIKTSTRKRIRKRHFDDTIVQPELKKRSRKNINWGLLNSRGMTEEADEPDDFAQNSDKSDSTETLVDRDSPTREEDHFWRRGNGHDQDLEECPVFFPTESEFSSPHEYISSLRSYGEKYGIIKIVPPESFKPPFGIDIAPVDFRFNTRWQALHKLQHPELPDSFTDNEKGLGHEDCAFHVGDCLNLDQMLDVSSNFEKEYFGNEWICGHAYSRNQWHGCHRSRNCTKFNRHTGNCKEVIGTRRENSTETVVTNKRKHLLKEIESEFWRIVESPTEEVYILYGADIDTTQTSAAGAAFPLPKSKRYISIVDGNMKRKKEVYENLAQKLLNSDAEAVSKDTMISKECISSMTANEVLDRKLDPPVSLAMRKQRQVHNFYRNCPWNPYLVAKSSRSILRHVNNKGEEIPGLTKPFIYVGTVFSTFAWHTEDHHLYSLNYHHFGAEKIWYAIPPSQAELFEAAVRKELHPSHAARSKNVLYELTTVLSPRALKRHGITVHTAIQREGEFMVTFPRAYHSGFNCGFNCAEAVNFACDDWLVSGWQALSEYRKNRRPVSFSMEMLLISIVCNTFRKLAHQYDRSLTNRKPFATNDIEQEHQPLTCQWIQEITDPIVREKCVKNLQDDVLSRLATSYDVTSNDRLENWAVIMEATKMLKEIAEVQKKMFKMTHVMKSMWLKPRLGDISRCLDDVDCEICKRELFLSGVCCGCKTMTCGLHAFNACDCPTHQKQFVYRMTPHEISSLAEVVSYAAKYHISNNVHRMQSACHNSLQ